MLANPGRSLVALSIFLVSSWACAQQPAGTPIRLILEVPAGASADISARKIAQLISESMQQPVVVENRPGASGSIAADAVAKARADGTTLLYGGMASLVYYPATGGAVRYDAKRDFVPVALGIQGYPVLVAGPALGVKSLGELVRYAKEQKRDITCATGGQGSIQHFVCAQVGRTLGVPMRYVPYKGSSPALVDTAGGQTDVSIASTAELEALATSGKLVPLATLAPRRSLKYPAVPTLKEASFDAVEFPMFTGFFAPGGTPESAVQRVNQHVQKALAQPEIQEWLRTVNGSTLALDPSKFAEYVQREQDRSARIAKENAIELK